MMSDILHKLGVDPAELEPQTDHSWAFDPHLDTTCPQTAEVARQLAVPAVQSWTAIRKRIRADVRDNVTGCARVILLNLIHAARNDPKRAVGIGTRRQALNSARRYRPDFMTERAFVDAMDHLKQTDTIVQVAKGYQHAGGAKVARYRLSDNVMDLALRQAGKDKADFYTRIDAQNYEIIRLKDRNGRLRNYKDTAETRRMRDNLDRINSVLASAQIIIPAETFDNDAVAALAYEGGLRGGVRLYRTFNGSSFDNGGRFFGAWWIQRLKKQRPCIQINGLPTVEADYRGLYAAILFAERGMKIPDDPYSCVSDLSHGKDPAWRKAVKTTFNAMLNAKGKTAEPSEFDLTPYGITKQDFQQMVRDAFPAFRAEFRAACWGRLQRTESDLMEAVLLHFAGQGVPVLPIHDGAIIQADRGEELRETMQGVFLGRYGQRPPVRLTKPPLSSLI